MTARLRWVTPIPPDRDGGGGAIRQAHLLLALAREYEIDLVVAGSIPDQLIADAMASVTTVPPLHAESTSTPTTARRVDDLRHATLSRFHREVSLHAPVRKAIGRVWKTLPRADIVNVEFAALAPLVRRKQKHERWMITLHNLRSGMAPQLAAITAGRRQRWLLARDERKAKRFETWVGTAYDRVVVVSELDAAGVGHATVIPNGVDLHRFKPTPIPNDPQLLLSGALYTGPNIDGALWLVQDILPLVRERVPDARLDIVGLDPVPEIVALRDADGVTVHANVKSVVPFLERARVALVPLRIGTGTRLKALEAMAAGRPVVGTTIGLGGLAVVDGVHTLERDSAEGIAEAIVRLLGADEALPVLTREGRALVESRYDWQDIGRSYLRMIAQLAAEEDRDRG